MGSKIKDNIAKTYNSCANIRDKNIAQDWKVHIRKEFLEYLKEEDKKTLLDLGAGTGIHSEFFKQQDIDVKAIDISREMVKLCLEKGIKSFELDFYKLYLLKSKFDSVWAMNSLLHIEKRNISDVLKQIDNILNPSGLFYMGVYGGEDSEGIWEDDIYQPPRFFSFYSSDKLKKVLSQYFELISFKEIKLDGKFDFQSIIMRKK
ncbi:class I SAM-dependent methyltransferase [Sporosalibacterium faouarense]|uniref:class I SAM-dependent methyltransferase n=1 Tax=Sporosalibacterium faouarense TaxID=516123 RepID=UPI00141D3A98|nr:class I SAM-dependent methyltransferase [Sporosalibacterium faouarense]MTI47841.1 methyltransferase domain-containing protein [Bacillota bacterium]